MTADGDVMGIPINGNIQLYYYRDDLFKRMVLLLKHGKK